MAPSTLFLFLTALMFAAIAAQNVDTDCTDQTQCGAEATTHLTCVSSKCACIAGYSGSAGGDCSIDADKFGGSCTTDTADTQGSCDDENALCSATSGGTCGCKTGYTGTDGAGCVKSGAKGVVASVTSLVLACIVCLLAIN